MSASDSRWRLRHLPLPLAASAVLVLAAGVLGGLVGGGAAAFGAGLGVALVAFGYLLSTLVIAWADSVAPALVMSVGLMAYVVKLTMIAGVMLVAAAADWAGVIPMAWGIATGVVGWIAAHIWWLVHHPPRLLYGSETGHSARGSSQHQDD